jgi:hypothetical protein
MGSSGAVVAKNKPSLFYDEPKRQIRQENHDDDSDVFS